MIPPEVHSDAFNCEACWESMAWYSSATWPCDKHYIPLSSSSRAVAPGVLTGGTSAPHEVPPPSPSRPRQPQGTFTGTAPGEGVRTHLHRGVYTIGRNV